VDEASQWRPTRLHWELAGTSLDYALPLGKGQRWLSKGKTVDLILGGWHLGGIINSSFWIPVLSAH
jgi:hypothetical protein